MDIKKRILKTWKSGLLTDLQSDEECSHTRIINPKLGLLGIFGLTGFLPLIINNTDSFPTHFMYLFFMFFGFFGFYYEGKLSNTLKDERFLSNCYRAEALANKIALVIIILVTFVFAIRSKNTERTLSILLATIGLAFGLAGFLHQYLLYRFENEE